MSHITEKYKFLYWSAIMGLLIIATFLSVPTAHATSDIDEDKEDGGITQHDMFEFEAFIKHGDVKFGTAPFDTDDKPGNDSADDNGIVRSWDTVTYPLKITVNPKKADSLKNIKLKISGELENGVTDDRINAKFAVGSTEDINKKTVSFVQDYTIERTGNSIMIPVTIEVQGAKHGIELKPNIKVEVVSVDGKKISGVERFFDELPSATTSAKVSIKPIVNAVLVGDSLPYLSYSKMFDGGDTYTGIQQFAISWSLDKLDNKKDNRGATMPDSNGEINYRIELYGDVYWDSKATGKEGTERLNFQGRDVPFKLFDYQDINTTRNKIGNKNVLGEGKSYSHPYPHYHVAARSKMPNYNKATIEKNAYNSVWDSGDWSLSEPTVTKHKVTYKGKNTNYFIGSTFPMRHAYVADLEMYKIYGINDKVFSTQAFMMDIQNEYRIGGINNPDNLANNVHNRVTVVLEDYVGEKGDVVKFNKSVGTSTVARNATGNLAAYGTFQQYPSGYTSPKNPYNYNSSVGDAHILSGQDVNFTPRLNAQVNLYGGYTAAYRWNTDAFELTKEYAAIAEKNIFDRGYRNLTFDWTTNDRKHQTVKYGIAKYTDNSFKSYTSRNIDDYTWYDTYDEAVKTGKPVGAMLSDVNNAVGGYKGAALNIPLRVKHDNIGFGSVTKNGTPVIALVNAHVYMDKDRKSIIDVTKNRGYNNYSEWDANGNLLKLQSPVGGGVNFETLAVIPAKTETKLESNKNTYYNSEVIKWKNTSSIILPDTGVPEGFDIGITVTQTIPKGLTYQPNSGQVNGSAKEPEVVVKSNGETDIVWDLIIGSNGKIPSISFNTSINPYALTGTGVQSSLQVTSVISSDLDGGPLESRSSTKTLTILKVGMVGIHESINKQFGPKNSDFTITLNPYTTIDDELNVAGLTHIPDIEDGLGSKFKGNVFLKDISLTADREHKDTLDIYLNDKRIETDKPNLIDPSQDGWYLYEGAKTDISNVQSIHFVVNGLMTNKDDIRINLTIQTKDNDFGDMYLNETVINSAIDYKLSPLSNRVRYIIRPEWELSMERIQIFTDKYDNGLPVRVRIGEQQPYGKDADISDLSFDLVLYDKETGEKVATQKVKQPDFKNEITMKIPKDKLKKKNDKRRYEAKLENYDTNRVWAKEPKIDTDGYTASEKTIKTSDIKDGKAIQAGVAVTERVLGEAITEYKDEITLGDVDIFANPFVTKSGYGYPFAGQVQYSNEMLEAVKNLVGINTSTNVEYLVDKSLVDENLIDSDGFKLKGDKVSINPSMVQSNSANKSKTSYNLEDMFIERNTGKLFTRSQVEKIKADNKESDYHSFVDASGNNLYVPIWIDDLGDYEINLSSKDPIGSNYVTFDLDGKVTVEAYMFNHINSKTNKKDEILINQFKN